MKFFIYTLVLASIINAKAQDNCHCSQPGFISNEWLMDTSKIIILNPSLWFNKRDNYFPDYSQGTELVFEDNFDGSAFDANKWYNVDEIKITN